eukprot:3204305-Alexandrium_andersonii.AAC.1
MAADVAATLPHLSLIIARRPVQAERGGCFGSNTIVHVRSRPPGSACHAEPASSSTGLPLPVEAPWARIPG